MPRCDCAGSRCTCSVVGGAGINVTGSGEIGNPYTIESDGGQIAGLLVVEDTASLDLSLTGEGIPNEPYVLRGTVNPGLPSSIAGFVQAGENITITGNGTQNSPYVISGEGASSIQGLVEAGQNVTLAGSGTEADPYVIGITTDITPDAITGLIQAGDNVVMVGTGTSDDPYIVNAQASSIAGLLTAGTGVEIVGSGTVGEPYIINIANLRIQDLSNVTTANPTNGDILTYNGSNWVSGAPSFVPLDPTQRSRDMITASVTWDPPALNPGDIAQINVTVPGLDYFDPWVLHVTKIGSFIGLTAWVDPTGIDRATIYLQNNRSDATVNLPSSTWTVYGWR